MSEQVFNSNEVVESAAIMLKPITPSLNKQQSEYVICESYSGTKNLSEIFANIVLSEMNNYSDNNFNTN